jgi:NADPH:quinone reductase-like Zn-dependent oxidoreductase
MSDTMRALLVNAPNAVFQMVDVPKPVPGPGQVLARIAVSGVNPLDTKIRAGQAGHAKHPLPAILGIDLAGTVEAVGPDVDGFQIGEAVYGMTGGVGGVPGSLAEYAAVDATVPQIIAHLSEFMRLVPGDVVLTGTPPGVAYKKPDPDYLRSGDVVRYGIEGLGEQCTEIVR